MKYLHDDGLSALTAALSDAVLGRGAGDQAPSSNSFSQRLIHGRIEAYTMKRAGGDKKYAQQLGERFVAEMESQENHLAASVAAGESIIPTDAVIPDGSNSSGNSNKNSNNKRLQRKRSHSVGTLEETSKSTTKSKAFSVSWADNHKVNVRSRSTGSTSPRPKKQARLRSKSFDIAETPLPPLCNSYRDLHVKQQLQLVGATTNKSALGDFTQSATRRLLTDLILTLNASFPDYDFGNVKAREFLKLPVMAAVRRINERLGELAMTKNGGGLVSLGSANCESSGDQFASGTGSTFLTDLWKSVDAVIPLAGCDVYTYRGETEDDPLPFLAQSLVGGDRSAGGGNGGSPVAGDASDASSDSMIATAGDGSREAVLWSFNYFFVNKTVKRIVFFTCVGTMRTMPLVLNDDEYADESIYEHDEEEEDADYVDGAPSGDSASEMDFDLDPASATAGGIPISIA